MPKLSQASRAVNSRRFVESGVNRRDCRQVNDSRIPERFPYVRKGKNRSPIFRFCVPVDFATAKRHNEFVQDTPACRIGKEEISNTRYREPRNKVREVGYRLHRLFEHTFAQIAKQQRQKYREEETEEEVSEPLLRRR